jgi:LemA protein
MPSNRFALLVPLAALSLAGCGINSIPTAQENAKAKWANVEADYQRRASLLPNLVATVKGEAAQEKSVLIGVTTARSLANAAQLKPDDLTDPQKVAKFAQAQGAVSAALVNIKNLQEAYPDLKSNTAFTELQSQIEGTENRITISIKDYNEAVQAYNTTIRTFPALVGAKLIYGSKEMTPYTATTPGADTAPKVDFGH